MGLFIVVVVIHVFILLQWFINGGTDASGRLLGDTWMYSIDDNTWTQLQTFDVDSSVPAAVTQHRALLSPSADQLVRALSCLVLCLVSS